MGLGDRERIILEPYLQYIFKAFVILLFFPYADKRR